MSRRFVPVRCTLVTIAALLIPSTPLFAQADLDLSLRLLNLYAKPITEVIGHFPTVDDAEFQELFVPFALTATIGDQSATFPTGSSAGGFTYTFDPQSGAFTRSSHSFGPAFAERALTVGRGRLNFGVNYQRVTYDSLEGKDLDEGEIGFLFPVTLVSGGVGRPGVLDSRLSLKLSTDTVNIFGTYGVTDRLDVGISVPIVHTSMEASLQVRGRDENGNTVTLSNVTANPTERGSASGIGDVVLRAKYRFYDELGGGIAAGLDLRLPSGDENNLLGSGATQTKLYVIGSAVYGRISPHANFGYTFSSDQNNEDDDDFLASGLSDEFNYAGGVDVVVTPRVTIAGDIIGRALRDYVRLEDVTANLGSNLPNFPASQELGLRDGSLNLLTGAIGVKANVWTTLLVSAHVLFPLGDSGLRDNFTPVIGVDWSF